MLKSAQKSMISVVRRSSVQKLSVFQSQCTYCSSSNNDESKQERRERLLRIRHEQKQLFGRVIRDVNDLNYMEPADDDTPIGEISITQSHNNNAINEPVSPYDIPNDAAKVPDIKMAHPERESEFYWLAQTSRIKIFKTGKSRAPSKNRAPNEKLPPVDTPATSSQSSTTSSSSPPEKRTNLESSDVDKSETFTTKISPANAIISAKNLMQQFVWNRRNDKQEIPFDEAGLTSIVGYPLICEKRSSTQLDELLADVSLRLPSISKILQATMPESARFALRKWKLGKIAELGIDGFKEYEKDTLNRGKTFHSAIEQFLSQGKVPANDSPIIKLWQSIDSSLNQLKPKPVLLEQPILHADLKYMGIIDNVSIVE